MSDLIITKYAETVSRFVVDTTKYRTALATCDCAAWLTALAIYDDLPEGHPLEAHAYIAYRRGAACSKEEVMALIELLEMPSGSKSVHQAQGH